MTGQLLRDKNRGFVGLAVMALGLFPGDAEMIAQQRRPATKSTIASVLDAQLTALESQFVPAAEAMPADKYSFAPTMGEYNGVRTFALEVKHVATANFIFYSAILGQALPTGVNLAGATNGPDDIQTKDQILRFVKDSFALGHKAFATLTAQNATTPLTTSPVPLMNTRLALATWGCAHAWDH